MNSVLWWDLKLGHYQVTFWQLETELIITYLLKEGEKCPFIILPPDDQPVKG